MTPSTRHIAVVGLGYVGLPVAVAFARKFPSTIGFDVDEEKCDALRRGIDPSGEVPADELGASRLDVSSDPSALGVADFYIVAVPTPIDLAKRPDLGPLQAATRTVGRSLRTGDIVVYESTVYPGVTEEICVPILEAESGLKCGADFKVGYSPERINPGDREHTFERITKVVSAQDRESLQIIADVYRAVVDAGVHEASSIKVAEASKVIENIQRDLNIALMNELSVIFDRLGIDTHEVLAASGSKWNFLRFFPGLVGGHCIGVDPYYLTAKAAEVGITPQVILAGRRINDSMGEFVARATVKQLALAGSPIRGARVGILGLTFKENVSDLRNSRIPDIVNELESYGVEVLVHDPLASPAGAAREYGIDLVSSDHLTALDALVYAVPHEGLDALARAIVERPTGVLIDIRARLEPARIPAHVRVWRL